MGKGSQRSPSLEWNKHQGVPQLSVWNVFTLKITVFLPSQFSSLHMLIFYLTVCCSTVTAQGEFHIHNWCPLTETFATLLLIFKLNGEFLCLALLLPPCIKGIHISMPLHILYLPGRLKFQSAPSLRHLPNLSSFMMCITQCSETPFLETSNSNVFPFWHFVIPSFYMSWATWIWLAFFCV